MMSDNPKRAAKIHAWLAVVWFIAAFPIMIFWPDSVPLLLFISVYANVAGHWSSHQAALAELRVKNGHEQG